MGIVTERTAADAERVIRERLQAVVSCVSRSVVVVGRESVSTRVVALSGAPVPLRGRLGVALEIECKYRAVPDAVTPARWTPSISTYAYRIDAADGRELIAFHWHPTGLSDI